MPSTGSESALSVPRGCFGSLCVPRNWDRAIMSTAMPDDTKSNQSRGPVAARAAGVRPEVSNDARKHECGCASPGAATDEAQSRGQKPTQYDRAKHPRSGFFVRGGK